jgi:hypothetical protein
MLSRDDLEGLSPEFLDWVEVNHFDKWVDSFSLHPVHRTIFLHLLFSAFQRGRLNPPEWVIKREMGRMV